MSKVKKVLIVEDEKRMADLIALYLKPYNYSVQKVYEAHTALDYLANDTFDIVLLDIMMPEMSGWELCANVRELSNIAIIIINASDTIKYNVLWLNIVTVIYFELTYLYAD